MGIPTFQEVMLPILKLTADGQTHTVKECVEYLEQAFNLTDEEKQDAFQAANNVLFIIV
jgi:restriction system protein